MPFIDESMLDPAPTQEATYSPAQIEALVKATPTAQGNPEATDLGTLYLQEKTPAPMPTPTAAPIVSGGRFIDESMLDPVTPSLFSDPVGALTSKDWWMTRPSGQKITAEQAVVGPFQSALNSMTGFGDEIVAGGTSALDALTGDPRTYEDRLVEARAIQKDTPLAADLLTGIPAALKMPIFAGSNAAPSMFRLAKEGALLGGIYGYGAGEGGAQNRLVSAGIGAGAGTVAGPVIGKTLEKVVGGIANIAANHQLYPTEFLKRLASQRGAIGSSGKPLKGFTPEELALAKELKNTPIEKILAARAEMEAAVVADSPLFLPEALKSPKVDRNARMIANYEPSMEFSQNAINTRTASAANRATGMFDALGENKGTFEGASKLVKAADQIVLDAEAQREKLTTPLYQSAYEKTPIIRSPELSTLIEKDQVIQRAIKEVRKTANNADLPEGSTRLLVKARQEISDKIKTAIKNDSGREAGDLTNTYNRLNDILHGESPELAIADKTFSAESGGIDELTGTFLKSLRSISDDKISNVGQIFSLPANRISELRGIFENAGKLDEWNAGIRAHLQNAVESTKDGRNFTDKIIGTKLQQDRLSAAVGDSFEEIASGLKMENRFFEGKNKYHAGSSTQGNLAEAESFKEKVGILRKIMNRDFSGVAESFFGNGLPDDVAQGLAKIYFDPKTGAETIAKIAPLMQKYGNNKKLSEAASKLGRREVISGLSSEGRQTVTQSKSQPRSQQTPPSRSELDRGQSASGQGRGSSASPDSAPSTGATQAPSVTPQKNALLGLSPKEEKKLSATISDVAFTKLKEAPDYIRAAALTESRMNPNAKNPDSSAKGIFQFVNATSKALGLKDPTDVSASIDAMKELTRDNARIIGSTKPEDLYAAHILGGPLAKKYLNDGPLTDEEQKQVDYFLANLPRFKKNFKIVTA